MNKRLIRVEAKEMHDAQVEYISLVDRPANRLPFRVTKKDGNGGSGMFNLGDIWTRKVDSGDKAKQPALAAIVLRKSEAESLTPALAEAGYVVDDTIEQDDVLVLKQKADFSEDACTGIEINDHVAALVENVTKGFEPEGGSVLFSDNIQHEQFWPSLYVALDTLMDTLRNIFMTSATATDAKTQSDQALKEFSAYVMSNLSQVPEAAFKLDSTLREPIAKMDKSDEGVAKSEDSGEEKTSKGEGSSEEAGDAGEEGVTKGDGEENEEGVAKSEEPGTEEGSPDDGERATKADTSEVTESVNALKGLIGDLTGAVSGIKDTVEKMSKDNAAMGKRLDDIEAVAKSAKEAVEGTVVGSDGGSERPANVQKGEKDPWAGTALDKLIG